MTRRPFLPLVLFALTAFPGCGKKGPIEPPLIRIPQAVQDLVVLQRGGRVFLYWTNPEAYIDGNPIESVAEVEVWLIREDTASLSEVKKWAGEEFENEAALLIRIPSDRFGSLRPPEDSAAGLSFIYLPNAEDFGRRVLTFALRVRDGKKRASDFTEPVSLDLRWPPPPPQKVRAEVFEDHILVRWEDGIEPEKDAGGAKTGGYNVYRLSPETPFRRLNPALIKGKEYSDTDFLFGESYRYFVRSVLESTPGVESEDSEPVEVTARDTFPPASPSGLTVIGGSEFIVLSWEANGESDLEGYKVWRRIAGKGEFVLIATLTAAESAFQDAEVEKKTRYEYAITAFDTAGNESRKSESASGIMRDIPPE